MTQALILTTYNMNDILFQSLSLIYIALSKTAVVWIPLLLTIFAWRFWIDYVNAAAIENIKWVMLEIRIPKEVTKTPKAMELVLINALHQTGGVGTWYHRWWLGNVLPWFSLEVCSIGGELHFFVRTQDKFRRLIESQVYAQYPTAEVVPVDTDYAELVPQVNKNTNAIWSTWGTEFTLSKEDPYPIKTYVDYGLDKSVKPDDQESQIDPISPMLELMGALKQGEQLWFQVLVRAHNAGKPGAKSFPKEGHWFERNGVKDITKEQIAKIIKDASKKTEGEKEGTILNLTKGQGDVISAIEHKMSQIQFECGMRMVYLAKKDAFDPGIIVGMMSVVKQYNSQDMNGFKPQNAVGVAIDFIDDPFGKKTLEMKKTMYNAYRLRSYFNKPYERVPFILSAEELATIYHFPNRATSTPSFARIDSKQAEPPQNLPI